MCSDSSSISGSLNRFPFLPIPIVTPSYFPNTSYFMRKYIALMSNACHILSFACTAHAHTNTLLQPYSHIPNTYNATKIIRFLAVVKVFRFWTFSMNNLLISFFDAFVPFIHSVFGSFLSPFGCF